MRKTIFYTLAITLILLNSCINDDQRVEKINKHNQPQQMNIQLNNINSLSIFYKGKINEYPASVKLFIADKGKKIRADFHSFKGVDTQQISYLKINDKFYTIDYQNKIKSSRPITQNDFLNFFYFPTDKLLKIKSNQLHFVPFEDTHLLSKKCKHLKIKTDTSNADFYVWNNILLKINTRIEFPDSSTTLKLYAKVLEENTKLADSLFKIDFQ